MPRLYQGTRGGVFYKKNGRKVYVNSFGSGTGYMYNPINRDILIKFIQYIKFTDPTIFVKLLVFDMDLTKTDISIIFGYDVDKNKIQNELKNDKTKLIELFKKEHSTDPHTIPQVPEFIMDSILNLSFSQKGSKDYENAIQPCILVFVIDLMMKRILDYEGNVILPDIVRGLQNQGVRYELSDFNDTTMNFYYGIISNSLKETLGYNTLIIEGKIKELLGKINIRQDIKNTLYQRVGFWKSQESNLIERTIKGVAGR